MSAIDVYRVSKTYRIPHERQTTLVERLLSAFRPSQVELLRALDDVSLEVPKGAFVGVIGSNGSGKSTLLKLMAGVLVPDAGQVNVHGSLVPLLELGLGFNQELTARENVALYGSVLGYPRAELDRRIEEVVAFAELARFRDAKLKNLSSGMIMRLAFATALRAEADILLLDEVMAVGDARFQQKCVEVFKDLKRQKKTIILVTHDLSAVKRFCDQAFWLDKGRLAMAGDATQVVAMYLAIAQSAFLPSGPAATNTPLEHRFGDGRIRIVQAQLESDDGTPATSVRSGARIVLRLQAEVKERCSEPAFGIIVHRGQDVAYTTNNVFLGVPTGVLEPGDRCEIRIPLRAALSNGHYTVTVGVASTVDGAIHDWLNHLLTFIVEGSACADGIADLGAEFHWTVDRPARADTATAS
jgi:ABC-type polysaccharide/polyol phosphate transport system ATPase subunit